MCGLAIDVVDASALERNMLLTVQMLEMGAPVVLCCNMMDEARAGIHIDMERLSSLMGIPVLPMVARTGEGLTEAMSVAVQLAKEGKRNALRISYGSDIDPCCSIWKSALKTKVCLQASICPTGWR